MPHARTELERTGAVGRRRGDGITLGACIRQINLRGGLLLDQKILHGESGRKEGPIIYPTHENNSSSRGHHETPCHP